MLSEFWIDTEPSEEVKLKVKQGAHFLDEAYPEWKEHILLPMLDISNPSFCILGQLAANPTETGYGLFRSWSENTQSPYVFWPEWAQQHGFSGPTPLNELQKAWHDYLLENQ